MEQKVIMGNICVTEWKPSPVFPEEYAISSCGDVWSVRKRRTIKPAMDKSGYLYYVLCVDGKRRTVKAHRLVGMAFIPNEEQKPTINHKNGIRTDNRVENLEWATHKEQKNDPLTKQHMAEVFEKTDYRKMGEKRNFGRLPITITWTDGTMTECGSLLEASKMTGKSYSKLSEVINKKRKQYKDFCIAVTKHHFKEGEEDD